MFSPNVYKMLTTDELFARLTDKYRTTWGSIEYNDLDFWWRPEAHDNPRWFMEWPDMPDWPEHLSEQARDVLTGERYAFYTCHNIGLMNRLLEKFPNAKVLRIAPDLDLVKRNYELKKPPNLSAHFPEYDAEDAYTVFINHPVDTALTFSQQHIYDKELFTESILKLANNLGVELDIDPVLEYRKVYLAHPMNQI